MKHFKTDYLLTSKIQTFFKNRLKFRKGFQMSICETSNTTTQCSRSFKIYAKNGANSCLNLTVLTIPTCKALIGDLQTTVQI